MRRAARAGLAYVAVVFAVGFVLGTARTILLVPRLGERAAELLEAPLMIVASFLAARAIVRRFGLDSAAMAFVAGVVALGLLAAGEIAFVLRLRGVGLAEYVRSRDPVSGSVYLLSLLLFAAMPELVRPRAPRGRVAARLVPAFLAALVVFAYARYRVDIAAARTRVERESRVVATPCGPIEYAEAGAGPPLLVVHGAGGGWDQGLDFGRPLAEKGFRVVAMSRFGYLRTPLPADASPATQADAHACLLDALAIPRAAIAGASAGAPSAMQFALRHPDRCRALVLLVPAAYVPRPGGAPPLKTPKGTPLLFDTALRSDFLFWSAIRLARPLMIRSILATPVEDVERASAAERARARAILDHVLPVSPRRVGLRNDAAVTSTLPRYDLERIGAPTLVMSVEDDLFGTWEAAKYTAAHVPNARFVGYPTGGHVWIGHEDEGLSEIAAFLR